MQRINTDVNSFPTLTYKELSTCVLQPNGDHVDFRRIDYTIVRPYQLANVAREGTFQHPNNCTCTTTKPVSKTVPYHRPAVYSDPSSHLYNYSDLQAQTKYLENYDVTVNNKR
jgi:hypothetical protein